MITFLFYIVFGLISTLVFFFSGQLGWALITGILTVIIALAEILVYIKNRTIWKNYDSNFESWIKRRKKKQ